jgi:hypothetical protein
VYDQARLPALVDARIIATLRAALSVGPHLSLALSGPVRSDPFDIELTRPGPARSRATILFNARGRTARHGRIWMAV